MLAIEFQGMVNADGNIAIPAAYRAQIRGHVKVIILTHELSVVPSIIDRLLQHPRPVTNFTPLSRDAIYDRTLP